MLTPLLSISVGLVLGFLSGLGVGGGSLLILWLTLISGTDQATARAVNLLFFLASAGSVSILRLCKGNFHLKAIWPAIISGCLAAAIGSLLGPQIEQNILRKIFGGLLLITGIRELCYRPRKAK